MSRRGFMTLSEIRNEIRSYANPAKAASFSRFFKTEKAEYGEAEKFLGVQVPKIRKVAEKLQRKKIEDHKSFLHSKWHEERLLAVISLSYIYKKADQKTKHKIFKFVNNNIKGVNNWDLVDILSPKIYGPYVLEFDKYNLLKKHARSKNLWNRRIAIVSTFAHLRAGSVMETYEISNILLEDDHDLIHKAVGWLLREAGKRDMNKLYDYIGKNGKKMPRTMLRYAIEKVPEKKRKKILLETKL